MTGMPAALAIRTAAALLTLLACRRPRLARAVAYGGSAMASMLTAWSALAQSIPAVTPPGGVSGRAARAYFITASSLLAQWGGTLVHGSGTRQPVVSLIGAHLRIQPC